jgi:hypothetical protein
MPSGGFFCVGVQATHWSPLKHLLAIELGYAASLLRTQEFKRKIALVNSLLFDHSWLIRQEAGALLSDPNAAVRATALSTSRLLGINGPDDVIARAAEDTHAIVRFEAVRSLGSVSEATRALLLSSLTRDPSKEVRAQAQLWRQKH